MGRLSVRTPLQGSWPLFRSASKTRVHFLHIGKTAGTNLKTILSRANDTQRRVRFVGQAHKVTLRDLPPDEDYFFAIRDPIARFISGFYSRKREGRPCYHQPWSVHERQAFADFPHARDLADALFQPGERGMQAVGAMKALRHAARNQVDWFALRGEIFSVRQPVWIVRQEHFADDLAVLMARCGVRWDPGPDEQSRREHVTDYSEVPPLTARGKKNLRAWYAQDYAFCDACATWIAMQFGRGAADAWSA